MYRETKIAPWAGGLLIAGFLLAVFVPWVLSDQELYRQEALLAVQASEFDLLPVATLHHVAIRNAYPLFPALAALLNSIGIPAETALRLLSFFFLCAGTILVYFAASNGSGKRAGLVGAAMYCSSILMIEKGIEGTSGTMNAFWVLAAQMSFFYFGLRQGKWNLAWCSAGVLLLLGYYSGGTMVLLFFIAPMFFFRRPLAGKAKFRHWGFIAALALVGSALLLRGVIYWSLERRSGTLFWWRNLTFGEYFGEVALYGVYLIVRLMPWSFFAWIPFCAALQAIDPKPLFSKYLRTQVFTSAALLWLLPKLDMQEKFYLLGNLSILCGIYYDLGTRRFGEKLRPVTAFVAEYAGYLVAAVFLAVLFVGEEQIGRFISIENTLRFRDFSEFRITAWILIALLAALSLTIRFLRRKLPVWIILFAISAMAGAFTTGILRGYRAQAAEKKNFGREIRCRIESDQGKRMKEPVKLYKCDIRDLYGELFYAGTPVYRLNSSEELPEKESVVYLLSTEFPQNPKRRWRNLLPQDFRYRNHRLMLWKGERNTLENSDSEP